MKYLDIAAEKEANESEESLWWSNVKFRGGALHAVQFFGPRGLVAIRKPPGATPLDAVVCANKAWGAFHGRKQAADDGADEPALIPVEPFLRRCSSRPIQGWSLAARSREARDELVRRMDEVSGAFAAVVDDLPRRADGRDEEEGGGDVPRVRLISSRRTRNTASGRLHLVEIECPRLARDGAAMKSILRKEYGCSVVGGRAHNVAPLKGLGGKGARTCLALIRLSLPGLLGGEAVRLEQEVPPRYFSLLERQERAFNKWREQFGKEGEGDDVKDGDESDTGSSSPAQVPSVSFCGRKFSVPKGVFSPRAGTEALVEAALESLPRETGARVLDLGTGTGCLLLSALLDDPSGTSIGVGVDFSPEAVDAARANAARLGISSDRATFVVGDFLSTDLFDTLSSRGEPFDVIICNPPYLDPERLPPSFAEAEEKLQTPSAALFAGEHGLDVYRAFSGPGGLVSRWNHAGLVKSGTVLVLELPPGGARVAEKVVRMFVAEEGNSEGEAPQMESLGIRRDGRNSRRCVVLRWP